MMEAVLVVATIAQKFRLSFAVGQAVLPWPTATIRPRDGLRMGIGLQVEITVTTSRCSSGWFMPRPASPKPAGELWLPPR
jgi:hypothetical protein